MGSPAAEHPSVSQAEEGLFFSQKHFDKIVAEMSFDLETTSSPNATSHGSHAVMPAPSTDMYSPGISFETPQSTSSYGSLFRSPINTQSSLEERHTCPNNTDPYISVTNSLGEDGRNTLLLPRLDEPQSHVTPPKVSQVTSQAPSQISDPQPLKQTTSIPLDSTPTQPTLLLPNVTLSGNSSSIQSQPEQEQRTYGQLSTIPSIPSLEVPDSAYQPQDLRQTQESNTGPDTVPDIDDSLFMFNDDTFLTEPSTTFRPSVRFSESTIARDEGRGANNIGSAQHAQVHAMRQNNVTPNQHHQRSKLRGNGSSMTIPPPYSGIPTSIPYGMTHPMNPQLVMAVNGRNHFYPVPGIGSQWGNSAPMAYMQHPMMYHPMRPSQIYGLEQHRGKRPKLQPIQTNGLPQSSQAAGLISEVNNSKILQTPWMRAQTPASALKPYHKLPTAPQSWGPPERPTLFRYTGQGQWLPPLKFSDEELRSYVQGFVNEKSSTRRQLKAWIQSTPAEKKKSKHLQCRWADCPAPGYEIHEGFFRVAFDEFSGLRGEELDPFTTTGCIHLHCFEKVFDIAQLHSLGIAVADHRKFPFEASNPFALDNGNILLRETFRSWARDILADFNSNGVERVIDREDNLWFYLTQTLVESMPPRLQKRLSEDPNALVKHMGDLDSFAQSRRTPETQRSYKIRNSVVEMFKNSKRGQSSTKFTRNGEPEVVDLTSQLETLRPVPRTLFGNDNRGHNVSPSPQSTSAFNHSTKGKNKRQALYMDTPTPKRYRTVGHSV
ncbi:hypothetical protein BROUX41_004185 [Berkeleyomyces rouxiae]|uniref:uncharacterized protein n=1 Tax=Berkeleyomyces rouxiae TaxID=2035830 RepID=UPI003B7E094C